MHNYIDSEKMLNMRAGVCGACFVTKSLYGKQGMSDSYNSNAN